MKAKIKFMYAHGLKKSGTMAVWLALMFLSTLAWSQPTLPFAIVNNSTFTDANVYVAVVGIVNGNHSWIDCKTSAVRTMSTADNTITGPVYGGDMGPGGNAKYANCFSRLSEIPGKTINVGAIGGCRILISFNSQLYLYFFGNNGGYAAPNLSNGNDPNTGIRFEMIELTNGSNGLWANTTRVDSYQYPMGLEVWGNSSFYKKVGEIKTHSQIISQWQAQAPAEFQPCLNTTLGIIKFPSKNPPFQAGGASGNYFQSYIDAIWAKYSGGDLVFNAGDAGIWRGRVSGSAFNFTRSSDGAAATITRKPTTQEVMEGSGAFASGGQWDLVVQAQMCAALNRHALDLNIATGATQDWSNAAQYYTQSPFNWYCKFWHQSDISFNSLTYAFCYDDVFDKSSTINAPSPTRATITIGGFAGTSSNTPPTVSITSPANGATFTAPGSVTINATAADPDGSVSSVAFYSGSTLLGTDATSPYSYAWTNVAAGTYSITARATDNGGLTTTSAAVNITVGSTGTAQQIPGTIQAESYTAMFGIQTENTTDTGGGLNVGFMDANDWMDYNVNVNTSGSYTVALRVAAMAAGGQLQLRSGATVLATASIPATSGWQIWTTVNVTANLTAGIQTLRAYVVTGGFNLNWIQFTGTGNTAPTVSITSPANGATFSAPASITINANAADPGGSVTSVAFYNGGTLLGTDTSSPYSYAWTNVAAGTYSITARATDNGGLTTTSAAVNITVGSTGTAQQIPGTIQAESYTAMSGIQTENTTDTGGGLNVGFIDTNDWMDYSVNVVTPGAYTVGFRVASIPGGGQVQIRSGATVLATANVATTGGWQTWTTVNATANLTAGTQTLRVHVLTGGFNLNWIQFTSNASNVNLALNKGVTVSSNQDAIAFPPAAAVDGNLGTRWSSAAADPQWIYVDLGANYNVNRVKVTWETAMASSYQIQIATAATGPWTTMRTITGNTVSVNDNTGLTGTGRYVRIYGTARATIYGYSIWELEVYGTASAREATVENLELKNDKAISFYPNPVTNIVNVEGAEDGDDVIIHNTNGTSQHFKVYNRSIDVSELSEGIYIIQLSRQKNKILIKK